MEEARLAGATVPRSRPMENKGRWGLGSQSVSRHQSARPEAQRFRTYHPNAGQASQWGAGVPSLLPRAPKLDILEVNGLNKVDFPRLARLVDRNWQALAPCPSPPVPPVSLSLTLNPLMNASHGSSVGPTRLRTPLSMGLYSRRTHRLAH